MRKQPPPKPMIRRWLNVKQVVNEEEFKILQITTKYRETWVPDNTYGYRKEVEKLDERARVTSRFKLFEMEKEHIKILRESGTPMFLYKTEEGRFFGNKVSRKLELNLPRVGQCAVNRHECQYYNNWRRDYGILNKKPRCLFCQELEDSSIIKEGYETFNTHFDVMCAMKCMAYWDKYANK